MKKLLILFVSLLFVAGFTSLAWAHGFKSGGSGFRGHGNSKSHYSRSTHRRSGGGFSQYLSRPSHRRMGGGFRQHRRHLHRHSFSHSRRHHLRGSRRSHRLPRIRKGSILSRPSLLQNKPFNSPIERAYARGIGVSPILKSQEKKALQQTPRHSHPSHSYHHNNPEPWFLYGKGKEFRQMGLIPSLPKASLKLK